MHAALAEVTDPAADPDRRAWHRAQAAAGPDEEVAAELERSAGRAQARGGLAAAAAFLERSVALTADPARHAERVLAAAQASLQAGAFGKALELLATAEAGPLDEFQRARVDLLRGHVAFASGLGSDAPPLLLKAARRLEPFDLELARETYLTAWRAAGMAGHLAGASVLAGDLPRRPGPPSAAGCSASPSPAARRPRPAGHRRTRRRDSDVAAGSQSARRHPRGGRPALGLDGRGRQRPRVGRRGHARDLREAGPARTRRRRAGAAADPPLRVGPGQGVDRRLRGCRLARRGDRQRGGGDREPLSALHGAEAPGTARQGSRGLRGDSERDRAGRGRRTGDGGDHRVLGGRGPVQRPRPLRGGSVGGPASHLGHLQPVDVHVGAARARRGGRARRRRRARTRCARAAGGDDAALRHRFRARHRGPLPGAAERRRRRRRPVPRGDRPAGPDPAASGAGPRPSAVRGVAAPRAPPRRRARAAARRPRACSRRSGWRRSPSARAGS